MQCKHYQSVHVKVVLVAAQSLQGQGYATSTLMFPSLSPHFSHLFVIKSMQYMALMNHYLKFL